MGVRPNKNPTEEKTELLSVEEMYTADSLAISSGIPGTELMDNAGRALADEAAGLCQSGRIVVLCGPGNNGGDGFIAARALAERNGDRADPSFDIRVCLLGNVETLKGDAKWAADQWLAMPGGEIHPIDTECLAGADLVIDALFGAGLARPIEGIAQTVISNLNSAPQCTVVSVDVPSGIDGNTGQALGAAVQATKTVTFFRMKPAHMLLPGRMNCGNVVCADIGIKSAHLSEIGCRTFQNVPALWWEKFPRPSRDDHKYTKGHALVVSGNAGKTGAARLAAITALRVGAGLVTVAGPPAAMLELASQLTTVMVTEADQPDALRDILADQRKNAVVIGPGLGVGGVTRDFVGAVLSANCSAVLDADALSSFESRADQLFKGIHDKSVLTPHGGEFMRLFPEFPPDEHGKLQSARKAAERSGGVVVFKGPDTVIAAPDGRAAINRNAPPTLATAGAGDVLAGMIGGLLAQGMPTWEAACAGVWLHGECATNLGRAVIAEDLSWALPDVLEALENSGLNKIA